ncbi:MAG: cyclic nucleotide-binding domain-containing protein [Myxococcales bacterium]|nr:cyclic nucleotide-binding domain-containing protein [Myxococcales bacterium]MCB9705057.1 cyclic nucleotide-binding domain-containing protein [Myxococcales bacterium]
MSDPSQPAADDAILELIREMLPEGEARLAYQKEIARGGIGAIGVAVDRALHRHVAMKTLHRRTYEEPILVRGFIREAQITGQLAHPNIVPVHDFGVDGQGQLYFTMKLVDGLSLSKLLARGREVRDDYGYGYERLLNSVEIMLKVCDALAFAHSRGVLHCDLKSDNIMVGDFGEVYLMDWGGAQLLQEREGVDSARWVKGIIPELPGQSTEGMVFGTPAYMSPEQALGKRSKMDERSDIFSLGAILYEIICGRAPFRAGSTIEALRLAQRWQIEPLDDLVDRAVVPRELVRIAMKAMAKAPDERYPTVEAMKLDLIRLVRGGSSFPSVRYPAGALIIAEGEVGDAAYIIVSGRVEAFKVVDGERVSLRIMGAGDVFGEMAIFAASPRTANIIALEETSLIIVTSEVINHEMDTMKPWMGAFIRALATRFASAERAQIKRQRQRRRPSESGVAGVVAEFVQLQTAESIVIDLGDINSPTELVDASEQREVTILTDVLGDEDEDEDEAPADGDVDVEL